MTGDRLWEASIRYSDGTLARRRFSLPAGWGVEEARLRAFSIWHLARYGSDGTMLNPTLEVAPC